jgi:calcium-dependent protein kinase
MLSAVRYLHSRAIVHRDLKLENFLFSSRAPDADLKMIDFGLSKHFELGEALDQKVGTPYTVAPEILMGSYDEKCDLWALGVITYLLLSGETPFGGLDGENMMMVKQSILKARLYFEPWDVWERVSHEGKAFVRRLLQADPKRRPTARDAQLDPWIQIWAKKVRCGGANSTGKNAYSSDYYCSYLTCLFVLQDVKEGARLNDRTVSALLAFKEASDMQKILSEVLSFTLLPDQIVDLRAEFEKIDTNGDGEISLQALKQVLMQNAEAGSLGALTEQEIEDVFDAIRIRKSDPTIRWHEFLAAGLSQAKIDDRNLRLAFDRLDVDRKG